MQDMIYRILSNKMVCYIRDNIYYIHTPSVDVAAEIAMSTDDIMSEVRFNIYPTEEQCHQFLVRRGIIADGTKDQLEKLVKDLEYWQIELYKSMGFKTSKIPAIRQHISDKKDMIQTLDNKMSTLSCLTRENFRAYVRNYLTVGLCITDKDNNTLFSNVNSIDDKFMERAVAAMTRAVYPHERLRELARSNSWRIHWEGTKPNPFTCVPACLNVNQRSLLTFTRMYDNAYGSAECPSDDVINDDDAFDGWLAHARNERESERNKSEIDKMVGQPGASDVFIPVANQEEAQKVLNYNDLAAQRTMNERAQHVKNHGAVKDTQLPDRQRELNRKIMGGN